ncbi:hypothetical protein ACO2Q3_10695 [Caulobacter sp. KR2-114]|uniref:hypothetical protein n=1 Tax=Caulobacter sp. KR2-114 TaxID=3400912 RepID=UPI003C075B72
MSSSFDALLDVAGGALGPGFAGALPDIGGAARTRELEQLLGHRDGFLAFEDALLVFPVDAPTRRLDLVRLNNGDWTAGYWHRCEGLLFFAADALGDLFALQGDKVVRFVSETGVVEPMADDLPGWAARLLADPAGEAGWPFAHAWAAAHGPLEEGSRLTGKRPFVLDGAFDLDNLQQRPLAEILDYRGNLATRLHEAPPGAILHMPTLS